LRYKFKADSILSVIFEKDVEVRRKQPALTVGLEEEMWLVDKLTGDLCEDWPARLLSGCNKDKPNQIVREFMTSQAELITKPCDTIEGLACDLMGLRRYMITEAEKYGLALMASSTHPTALWQEQHANLSKRYRALQETLQMSASRMLVAGMHVHIGIEDRAMRLKLHNQMIPFLPYILALTSSSPFWAGKDSGFNSYRLSVINGLPRSGLPPLFQTLKDYDSYVNRLISTQIMSSGRELWWDMRLSARYPTIEVRVGDTCTSIKDALAIAALIQVLMRFFLRGKLSSKSLLEKYRVALENRWRAQRYSILDGKLLSQEAECLAPFSTLITELLDLLVEDARELGSLPHLLHCRHILEKGTSADKQRQLFESQKGEGKSEHEAFKKVKLFLINETKKDIYLLDENASKKKRKLVPSL
jgi:carboxylate-amine ligase